MPLIPGPNPLPYGISQRHSSLGGLWGLGFISQRVYVLIIQIFQSSCCFVMKSFISMRSQFCRCHDSWAVMACAKLWPDLIISFHVRATYIFTRFGLWAHKLFVKCIPESVETVKDQSIDQVIYPGTLFINKVHLRSGHGYVIITIDLCVMWLLIHA